MAELETPMTMLCSSRDRTTILVRDTLETLGASNRWFTVVHTFTRSPADLVLTVQTELTRCGARASSIYTEDHA